MIPVKILAIILLVTMVTRTGHPLRAAVVLAVIALGLELLAGGGLAAALVRGVVSLVLGAGCFWLIDRTQSVVLGVVIAIIASTALIAVS